MKNRHDGNKDKASKNRGGFRSIEKSLDGKTWLVYIITKNKCENTKYTKITYDTEYTEKRWWGK